MSSFLEDIRVRVAAGKRKKIIFPEDDARVFEAAAQLEKEGLIDPVTQIHIDETVAQELEGVLMQVRAHKSGTPDELSEANAQELSHNSLMYSMYLLRKGEVDALVAGAVHTTRDVLRAALWLIGVAPGVKTISSSFYMLVPPFRGGSTDDVLTFADCGVVPDPTVEQLSDIAIGAADARAQIIGDEPRLALLSYSTKGSGGTDASIQKVRAAIALIRKKRPDISIAQDELQVDAALISDIAERKAPGDPIAGKANILIFPDLNAANIAYKLVERLVPGARAIGPILHGLVPGKIVHDLSRGSTTEDIVTSALVAALRASTY